MNKEGYKDPTQEKAVGKVARYERLCKKHKIKKGDMVKVAVKVSDDPFVNSLKLRTRKAKVAAMTEHYIYEPVKEEVDMTDELIKALSSV